MASVEQVQGQIAAAREQAQRGAAMLEGAASEIESAQQAFQEAAQGSNQSEANDVTAMFANALEKIREARDATMAAAGNAESYAARL